MGIPYRFVYAPSAALWGHAPVWITPYEQVVVSDLERTLLDGLTRPALCAGISQVATALWLRHDDLDWEKLGADHDTLLPCRVFAVQVDTRHLPEYVASDPDLYRLAFWRLLEEIDAHLEREHQPGMLMVDMRSDMHSSVQDRRLIDAYREWINSRMGRTRLVELPWFGFSAFYAGLQLADFAAYLMDFTSNELERDTRDRPLYEISARIRDRVSLIRIP